METAQNIVFKDIIKISAHGNIAFVAHRHCSHSVLYKGFLLQNSLLLFCLRQTYYYEARLMLFLSQVGSLIGFHLIALFC